MQFVCANNDESIIYGHPMCADLFEMESFSADHGYMLTYMKFMEDWNSHDCAAGTGYEEDGVVQSPAEPLRQKAVEAGLLLRHWSTTCAFYPRMSKFFEGTVSFELVHFPGHYLVASRAVLSAVVDGKTERLSLASLKDPHMTIERLEPQHTEMLCRHHQRADMPRYSDKGTSLPLDDETFRRASFNVNDLTEGDGVNSGSSGDAILAADVDDVAEIVGGADDDLGDAADQIMRVLKMWRRRVCF